MAKGKNVTLIIGARTAEQVLPAEMLPPQAELSVVTEDGSRGRKGFLDGHLRGVPALGRPGVRLRPARYVRVDGGGGAADAVRTPVQVLLETPMACGMGLCYGCAVETRRGVRQVCRDGPRFELRDVF